MIGSILLDMDGVLVDFIGGAASLYGKDPDSVLEWDFIHSWGMTGKDFWGRLGFEFWEGLSKTPEADEVVRLCEEKVGSENVCILSSPCLTKGCMDGKEAWLKKNFPQFSRRFLFGPAKSFCVRSNSVLVDDSESNVDDFFRHGGKAVLFPRPWNRNRNLNPVETLRKYLQEVGC